MIRIRDLRWRWPRADHDGLAIDALDVASGERLFVQGPSGCGKSTLLGLLAGVLVAPAGMVEVRGQDWARLSGPARDALRADHLGVIFQQFNLLPYLSLLDNVLLPCRFSTLRRDRATALAGTPCAAAERLLGRMELAPGLWRRRAAEVSVGQQQRVAAARALIGAPALVLADEPTSALDAPLRDAFMALLWGLLDEAGSTLVFVSHDERLAARFARTLALSELNRAGQAA